jgi:chromate transporter
VAATLGVIFPSFVIIYAISMFLNQFLEITLIANAFKGIKLAVGLLIISAAIKMFSKVKKTPLSLSIMVCACTAMLAIDYFSLNFSSIGLLVIAGIIGVVAFKLKGGAAE